MNWSSFKDLNEVEIEKKSKEIISKMSLDQKLSQMAGDIPLFRGLISMGIRYNSKPIPAGEVKELDIPPIKFTDGPRGVVMNNSTCFPVSMGRGASWDLDLEERIGNAIGIEARAQGANFFGGVCINLLRHPAWGRAQETYGEDPYHLGKMGCALTRGIQKHIMACAKHYAANSMENARFKVDVQIDERTLREIYLRHFKMCVDEGVASIMSAYNKINGNYCGQNKHILRDILKNDWNFKGFVISDFTLGVRNGAKAVQAGLDIEMPNKWKMKPSKLKKYLKKGLISETQIDDSVNRILRQKLRFNRKYPNIYNLKNVASKEHIDLALEAALKSIVLLKNKNNILPIPESIKKIGIFGKMANIGNIGDFGSSKVYPPYIKTPLEGIKDLIGINGKIDILFDECKDLEKTKEYAQKVEYAIIIVGYTHKDEGEFVVTHGGDRDDLRLKSTDEDIISIISENNEKTIVIIESGSSVIMENWIEKVSSVLMAWYPGMQGGEAIAKILFGRFNPCGKLPFIIPKNEEQLPFFDKKAKSIIYDSYHGYRLLDKYQRKPRFHFGFGLSYTNYEYSNLKLEKSTYNLTEEIILTVDIKNIGELKGQEIVQLYIGCLESKVERNYKELRGFKKIELNPNEQKTIQFSIKNSDLAYYNVEKEEWITELTKYKIYVGPSADNNSLLSTVFEIN